MSLKNQLAKVKAARAKRKPVTVNTEAEARRVRRDWAMEDAVHDLSARILFLAEVMDRLAGKDSERVS